MYFNFSTALTSLHILRHVALPLMLITLVMLGGCRQPSEAAANTKHDHSQHDHGQLEVTDFGQNTPLPSVKFSIEEDAMSGWNIHIETHNFHFTPEKINDDAISNEGHAHLYVDDFKMARLYSNWYHLKTLTPGEHTVRISLNANDHSEWSHQGQTISFSQRITQ